MKKFEKLFEPITIKNVTLKNRMVIPAMTLNTSDNGHPDQWTKDFYKARAKGHPGLIIFESVATRWPEGVLMPGMLGIDGDEFIPGLKELADLIHGEGVPTIISLCDAGRQTKSEWGGIPLAPTRLQAYKDLYPELPKEVDHKEIDWLVDNFEKAAERGMKAGFDGIEIHGGHGYLISSFISPYCNRRTDEYGGSTENRMRFPLRIVKAVRKAIGDDKLLSFRMCGTEFMSGGLQIEEAKIVAKMLVDAGVDLINLSAGIRESDHWLRDYSMNVPRGAWVPIADQIKTVIGDTPLMAVNRINRPEIAEQILRETRVDLVCLGRASIADPQFPEKAKQGKADDINTCIACVQGCYNYFWGGNRPDRQLSKITCMVNPRLQFGTENVPLKLAEEPKNVLVVGGGPAGLKVAAVAAERGHKVTLCEKEQILGGQLNCAARIPSQREFETLVNELAYQAYKKGVDVKLGMEVDVSFVEEFEPDVLVIATGVREAPEITKPGVKETDVKIVSVHELLRGPMTYAWAKLGESVAVLCSKICCRIDTWEGCETIEALVEKGKKVTFVTDFEDAAPTMPWPRRPYFLKRIQEGGVRKIVNAKIEKFTKSGIVVTSDGRTEDIAIDSLVQTMMRSDRQLQKKIKGVKEIYRIGDCASLGNGEKAISDAYELGLKI